MKLKEQKITDMAPKTIGPRILGCIHYNGSANLWNIIRLKKQIIDKFPKLKKGRGGFCYRMNFYENYEELEESIAEMKKKGKVIPMTLVLSEIEK